MKKHHAAPECLLEGVLLILKEGIIFNIQRCAFHDGPGIRTVVFLKGCPLKCLWCQNPEGQTSKIEIMFHRERCIGCGKCIKVCPNKAIKGELKGEKFIDSSLCDICGLCVSGCVYGAWVFIGQIISIVDLMNIVEKDRLFYDNSNGGVTLSGGEPFAQPYFTLNFLRRLKERGINTAVETSGFASWSKIKKTLGYIDHLLFDIKFIDQVLHKRFTGVDNNIILENAIRASKYAKDMVVRVPIITNHNDSKKEIRSIAEFISQKLKSVSIVHILPYNSLGVSKYKGLGRKYHLEDLKPPTMKNINIFKKIMESYDLEVQIGG